MHLFLKYSSFLVFKKIFYDNVSKSLSNEGSRFWESDFFKQVAQIIGTVE